MKKQKSSQRKPPRRSNVVRIKKQFEPDIVMQSELLQLELAQLAEWNASRRAALLSQKIQHALDDGAKTEEGKLFFDRELNMVRSRKKENASDGGSKKKEGTGS